VGRVSFSSYTNNIELRRSCLSTRRMHHAALTIILLSTLTAVASAQTPGSSPLSPAPVGKTVSGIVECGQGYTSHELYDMKITLIEVIRGEAAWRRLQLASPSNKQAASSQEYLIARVRFEYNARGIPGTCVHQLVPEQFAVFSSDGVDYKNPAVVAPTPEMRKGMKSGDTLEGWIVFAIPTADKNPVMCYSADAGGAVMHGGGKWFQLY